MIAPSLMYAECGLRLETLAFLATAVMADEELPRLSTALKAHPKPNPSPNPGALVEHLAVIRGSLFVAF